MEKMLDILLDCIGGVIVAVEDDCFIIWCGTSNFSVYEVGEEVEEVANFQRYCYKQSQAIEAAQDWWRENRC